MLVVVNWNNLYDSLKAMGYKHVHGVIAGHVIAVSLEAESKKRMLK